MLLEIIGVNKCIVIVDVSVSDKVNYKFSVDLMFSLLVKVYGGDVLGVILIGMGVDGKEGCCMLKDKGVIIWV